MSNSNSAKFSRRSVLGLGALGLGTAMASSRFGRSEEVSPDIVSVLAPLLPDPAPPGVLDDYLMTGLPIWEARHRARVKYETSAVENMKAKILINIRQGLHMHDVMYCAGWAQEIAGNLLPIEPMITPSQRADLPPWALNSFRWRGKLYGLPAAANPMILFANRDLLSRAGISELPTTWDDLLETAKATTTTATSGWTFPGGQTGGIGGIMSQWMLFFLQAGGELYDLAGKPSFASDAGVIAAEMLRKLLPYCDKDVLNHKSLIDASASFMRGDVAMMTNWAVMHRSLSNTAISKAAPSLATAPLPRGPVGTASIDSGDGWTIDSRTWVGAKAISLISFYLEPRIQKQMLTQTGWLPISLSALNDDDVRSAVPHADTVREQLQSRIESGFRPNYDVVTRVIGQELLDVLNGLRTPISGLRAARDQLNAAAASGMIVS